MFNWEDMKYKDVMTIKENLELGYNALFPFGNWYAQGQRKQPITKQAAQRIHEVLKVNHVSVPALFIYEIIEEIYKEMIGIDYVAEFFSRVTLVEEDDWWMDARLYVASDSLREVTVK